MGRTLGQTLVSEPEGERCDLEVTLEAQAGPVRLLYFGDGMALNPGLPGARVDGLVLRRSLLQTLAKGSVRGALWHGVWMDWEYVPPAPQVKDS